MCICVGVCVCIKVGVCACTIWRIMTYENRIKLWQKSPEYFCLAFNYEYPKQNKNISFMKILNMPLCKLLFLCHKIYPKNKICFIILTLKAGEFQFIFHSAWIRKRKGKKKKRQEKETLVKQSGNALFKISFAGGFNLFLAYFVMSDSHLAWQSNIELKKVNK